MACEPASEEAEGWKSSAPRRRTDGVFLFFCIFLFGAFSLGGKREGEMEAYDLLEGTSLRYLVRPILEEREAYDLLEGR